MSVAATLLFALGASLVLYGMHRLVWRRGLRELELPARLQRVSGVLLVLLGLSVVLAIALAQRWPADEGGRALLPAWLWLGILFYLFLGLAACWAGERLLAGRARRAGFDPARRLWFRRVAAGACASGAGSLAWIGERSATGEILCPEVPVTLARLPPALRGLRLAQLSDVHIGPLAGEGFLRQVVAETMLHRPDLIVITGDLVDGSVQRLRRSIEPLFALQARFGVYFVTGNHEYYSGAGEWTEYLGARGVRVLHNERVAIGDGGGSFDLAGIPDRSARRLGSPHAPDLARALAGRDPARETILLAHQPAQIDDTRGLDLGLQLSGHTHGGQLWPFGALVLLAQPYLHGLHRHEGRTQIFVSRGTGCWGPPMRVGNPPEIPNLILV